MSSEMILSIADQSVMAILMIGGPILLLSLVVGLIVSIIQAATQIQEQTLAFIPKIVAVLFGLILFGPWMLSKMLTFTENIFANLPNFIR
ncbi:flagellar biosynthesis protein FliQ [Sporolactobacillus terrae]|uniref:Flagellar biosynthetic protein FliQ n=1 Tax=Sporolactobacillus terrae TaxID=269673 RepID=A0A410D8F6_9BACL|nr:flagellar biosynthesis protein FliQ [Sporolactobacillus terrae]QAA22354.1 flagellar biosynthetic protein FliQ [Sporolactobacillus terrae]QAA25330.1 flagellar biosynthetic protein FliQ [Sporolactobacillus terrae]UAK17140.1 flagellar biosynthesis protein FliQ [Sporolactobacillus terrae]BBN98670.1 flagellar biosynthetic protein FliQ [Sporolactobacillus terrae]